MEEEKAAAYYDELTRKGGGAARFKQGLGFSSAATTTTSDDQPSRGSALPSSSSFLSNFVKASSLTKENEVDKKTQLENIQSKLKKKGPASSIDVPSEKSRVRDSRDSRRRSRSREKESRRGRSRSRERRRRRSRSRERRGGGGSDEERGRLRRRHKSPSRERRRERKGSRKSRSRSCSDDERRYRRSRRSRSISPRDRRRSEKGREGGGKDGRVVKREGNGAVDYTVLIDGYDKMTPAERVKAKMKLQLTQTAEKDTKMGTGSQWERFDFNKDAPVDDEEIEAADDDAELVKHIGKSFRFTSFEAKSEDKIKNAHDEAMFGVPVSGPSYASESGEERGSGNENENENKETKDTDPASGLINEKVLSKQQGSWRDRARRNVR